MKLVRRALVSCCVLAAVALVGAPAAVLAVGDPFPPPSPDWAGTTDIRWTFLSDGVTPVTPKRVGILAYCADLAHNAGDTGLQANKRNVRDGFQKFFVQGLPFDGDPANLVPGTKPWFLDGPFDRLGNYGAQNLADYFAYDDGIDRLRDVQIIDGDLTQPSAPDLIRNFDIVVAYTDNKCGQPIPAAITNAAGQALAGFVGAPGKSLILTGFAFSNSIGFGNAIFGNGLSPLRKGGPGLDPRCSRAVDPFTGAAGTACPIGQCPAGFVPTGDPAECRDPLTGEFALPNYQPLPDTQDFACDHMLANVNGPTSSSWATALTGASVAPGATLCFNYDVGGEALPFLAINAARNIVAINAFPPDAVDIQKFWFGCVIGNAIQWLSGDTTRCTTKGCH